MELPCGRTDTFCGMSIYSITSVWGITFRKSFSCKTPKNPFCSTPKSVLTYLPLHSYTVILHLAFHHVSEIQVINISPTAILVKRLNRRNRRADTLTFIWHTAAREGKAPEIDIPAAISRSSTATLKACIYAASGPVAKWGKGCDAAVLTKWGTGVTVRPTQRWWARWDAHLWSRGRRRAVFCD